MKLTELVMVVFFFLVAENSTVENIWVINHLCQRQAPIFIVVRLQEKSAQNFEKEFISLSLSYYAPKVNAEEN